MDAYGFVGVVHVGHGAQGIFVSIGFGSYFFKKNRNKKNVNVLILFSSNSNNSNNQNRMELKLLTSP